MHNEIQIHKQCLLAEATTRGRETPRERALSLSVFGSCGTHSAEPHTHRQRCTTLHGQLRSYADADRVVVETNNEWQAGEGNEACGAETGRKTCLILGARRPPLTAELG